MHHAAKRAKGQSLVEFALVLPIILIVVFGIAEFGRILLIFSEVNNASREAARFGASVGTGASGTVNYLDCNGMRQAALSRSLFSGMSADSIQIAYERPRVGAFVHYADCDNLPTSETVILGDRVVITVTRTVTPMLGILPIPPVTASLTTSRTILKGLPVGPPECRDGVDNDQDGDVDYPADAGCASSDDTIEAVCYQLQAFSIPPESGAVQIVPGPNCGNLYIEETDIELEAEADPRYEFDFWSGAVSGTAITATFPITQNASVAANFRLREADLQINKQDTDDPIFVGDDIRYIITVSNVEWNPTYPDPAHNVVVTDTLPSNVTFQSATIGGNSSLCTHDGSVTGGVIVCQVGTLNVGQSRNINVRVTAPMTPATVSNTAVVSGFESDPAPDNNTDTEATEILPYADLRITGITGIPETAKYTSTIAYSADFVNIGPSPATGVKVLFELGDPANAVFDPATPGCTSSGSVVTCPIAGTVPVNGTGTVTAFFRPTVFVGTVSVEASIQGAEFDDVPDNNAVDESTEINTPCHRVAISVTPGGSVRSTPGPNCESTYYEGTTIDLEATPSVGYAFVRWTGSISSTSQLETLTVNGAEDVKASFVLLDTDLSLTMTGPGEPVPYDTVVDYVLEVTNNGGNPANKVVITNFLPDGATFSSGTPGCAADVADPTAVTCDVGTLAVGASTSLVIGVRTPPVTSGLTQITNTASVSSIENDTGPSDNNVTVNSQMAYADVGFGSIESAVGEGGDIITFTIEIANAGLLDATGVVVTANLPANTSFSFQNDDCTLDGSTIWCNVGDVPAESTVSIALYLTPTITSGTIELAATVEANEDDPLTENNLATVETFLGEEQR